MPTPLNSFSRQQSLSQNGTTRLNLRGSTTRYDSAATWSQSLGTGAALNAAIPGPETGWSAAIKTAFNTGTTWSSIFQAGPITFNTDNITMMFRIYINSFVNNVDQYCYYNGQPNLNGYGIRYDGTASNNQRFNMLLGAIGAFKAGPAALSTGVWYHVTLRRSAGTWTLWVDGVSYALNSTNPNAPANTAFVGGWDSGQPNLYARAYFTDIVFLTKALSDAEIQRYATAPFI